MRAVLAAAPFIALFLLAAGGCIAAAVLNARRYRAVKAAPPIPLDLASPLPTASGFPWHPRYRGQRWPDPSPGGARMSVESARRYAGAAERKSRRCLLMGDAAIFILAIPSGLFAPMFLQRWPDPPPAAGWVSVAVVLASMIGGISLKVYAAPYWEAVSDAYSEAVERLTAAEAASAAAPAAPRGAGDRLRAAWRELFG
ncbi:hypothetical protein GCM10009830_44170 [Glycomyces endophyticus]|uniref:Uncharacterized protein n=1 Tax=Glycomyces endophyticus TaxID=480996 RepID=A0ABN2HQ55_9ACTN